MFGVLGRKRGPNLATAARKRRMTSRELAPRRSDVRVDFCGLLWRPA